MDKTTNNVTPLSLEFQINVLHSMPILSLDRRIDLEIQLEHPKIMASSKINFLNSI